MPSVSSPSHKERSLSKTLLKRAMLLALLLHLFGMVAVPNYAVKIIEKKSMGGGCPYPGPWFRNLWIPDLDDTDDEDVSGDTADLPAKLDGTKTIPEAVPMLSLPDPGVFIPLDTKPEIIRIENPSYPSIAQAAGIEAEVWAHMYVDVDGRVKDVRIISGHELFHESVREAAYRILFEPATFNNRKVAVWVAMKFDFIFED